MQRMNHILATSIRNNRPEDHSSRSIRSTVNPPASSRQENAQQSTEVSSVSVEQERASQQLHIDDAQSTGDSSREMDPITFETLRGDQLVEFADGHQRMNVSTAVTIAKNKMIPAVIRSVRQGLSLAQIQARFPRRVLMEVPMTRGEMLTDELLDILRQTPEFTPVNTPGSRQAQPTLNTARVNNRAQNHGRRTTHPGRSRQTPPTPRLPLTLVHQILEDGRRNRDQISRLLDRSPQMDVSEVSQQSFENRCKYTQALYSREDRTNDAYSLRDYFEGTSLGDNLDNLLNNPAFLNRITTVDSNQATPSADHSFFGFSRFVNQMPLTSESMFDAADDLPEKMSLDNAFHQVYNTDANLMQCAINGNLTPAQKRLLALRSMKNYVQHIKNKESNRYQRNLAPVSIPFVVGTFGAGLLPMKAVDNGFRSLAKKTAIRQMEQALQPYMNQPQSTGVL